MSQIHWDFDGGGGTLTETSLWSVYYYGGYAMMDASMGFSVCTIQSQSLREEIAH